MTLMIVFEFFAPGNRKIRLDLSILRGLAGTAAAMPAAIFGVMRRVALSAEEADRLDVLIQEMLRELKKGKTVRLPGVGALRPGRQVKFEREKRNGGARGKR